jgi:hypothetical protein
VGSNVVYLKGNGGQATMQGTNGVDLVSVGDNAELIIQDMILSSQNNTPGKAAIKLHGNGVVDVFANVRINGNGGPNDVGVYLDNGASIFAIFNLLGFSNTFKSLIWADRGGNISLGPGIQPTGALSITNFMTLMGQGYTTVGSAITTSGWSSPGATIVNTGHVLNTNGTSGNWPSAFSVTAPGVVI